MPSRYAKIPIGWQYDDAREQRMADFDLIAFDLDGTVFGIPFKQEVSERVYRAMQAAHDRGVAIAVATGRPLVMIGSQLQEAPWLDWGITVNGAEIVDIKGASRPFVREIPRHLAIKLVHELGDAVSWSTFVDETPYTERKKVMHMAEHGLGAFAEGSELQREAAERAEAPGAGEPDETSTIEKLGFNPIEAFAARGDMVLVDSVLDAFDENPEGHILKFGCGFDSAEAADAAFADLTERHKDLEIAFLNATELEITAAGVSKGSALDLLCWKLDIDPARAVAFGDSGNDISLTHRANRFVAMGNADKKIKLRADEVCATVREDGVARWIEENIL